MALGLRRSKDEHSGHYSPFLAQDLLFAREFGHFLTFASSEFGSDKHIRQFVQVHFHQPEG
jgi:hypothetical protein